MRTERGEVLGFVGLAVFRVVLAVVDDELHAAVAADVPGTAAPTAVVGAAEDYLDGARRDGLVDDPWTE